MERALLAMLTNSVREMERLKPGTLDLLMNALESLAAEREKSLRAAVHGESGLAPDQPGPSRRARKLYTVLMSCCDNSDCTTCGSVFQLRRMLIEMHGSERAVADEVLCLKPRELGQLLRRIEFYSFLADFSEAEWARLAQVLVDRFPRAVFLTHDWNRSHPGLFLKERVQLPEALVVTRTRRTGEDAARLLGVEDVEAE
jgi:hypothetical protein